MQDITISDEYIRLGQALKLSGFAESGVDAKVRIGNGDVTVNGEVETRRGKKLRDGDVVAMDGNSFTVHSKLADKA